MRSSIGSVPGRRAESGDCVVFGISLLFVMMTLSGVCVKVSSASVDYCGHTEMCKVFAKCI